MKTVFLFAVSILIGGVSAFAGDSGSQNGPGSYCNTYTTCRDGHQINCNATGGSCRWAYQDGASVLCVGYDGPNFTGAAHTSSMTCN